jgi:hypothetical protein
MLIQPGLRPETRSYSDYESLNECLEGICRVYEEHLKHQNPATPSITYDISNLFDFIDDLRDLSLLVCQKVGSSPVYVPHGKEWIKQKIYVMLREQADGRK